MKNTKKTPEQIYIDWFNNYLTVEKIAEDYQVTKDEMIKILNIGRLEHLKK